jgi:hypothetical protein
LLSLSPPMRPHFFPARSAAPDFVAVPAHLPMTGPHMAGQQLALPTRQRKLDP